MAAGVEMAIQEPLQQHADQRAGDECERKSSKERPAVLIDQHRAHIAARHGEGAMREVDEIHQPERDRKSAGKHEQQHAVGHAIEQIGENSRHGESRAELESELVISEAAGCAEPANLLQTTGFPDSRAGAKFKSDFAASSRPGTTPGQDYFLVLPGSFTASKVANSTLYSSPSTFSTLRM